MGFACPPVRANILKKMTESFIGAELLSGRIPDGKLRIG